MTGVARASSGYKGQVRTRILTAALIAVIASGSLALWTAIPAGWMYVTREMEPAGARFLLTIFRLLGVSRRWRARAACCIAWRPSIPASAGPPSPEPAPPSFLRTIGDDRAVRPRLGLLDTFMAALSGDGAELLALLLWWVMLANFTPTPRGPLQPLLAASAAVFALAFLGEGQGRGAAALPTPGLQGLRAPPRRR